MNVNERLITPNRLDEETRRYRRLHLEFSFFFFRVLEKPVTTLLCEGTALFVQMSIP